MTKEEGDDEKNNKQKMNVKLFQSFLDLKLTIVESYNFVEKTVFILRLIYPRILCIFNVAVAVDARTRLPIRIDYRL